MRITDSDPQSRLQQSDIASKISPDKRMQMIIRRRKRAIIRISLM